MESHQEILEKLKARTKIDETTGCWLWEGAITDGYGMIHVAYKDIGVHRVSAIINLGLNPNDKEQLALHKTTCPNRNCWNPEHLYIGTISQNIRDSYETGRPRNNQFTGITHCKYGHSLEDAYVHKNGSRRCKQCAKEYYERNKV